MREAVRRPTRDGVLDLNRFLWVLVVVSLAFWDPVPLHTPQGTLFWKLWGSIDLQFVSPVGPLGSILGALGPLGLHFGSSAGILAALWGPLGAPVVA